MQWCPCLTYAYNRLIVHMMSHWYLWQVSIWYAEWKKGDEYITDANRYTCRDKCTYYKKLFIKSILDDFANEPSIHQEKVLIGQLSYSAYKSRLNVCVS